MKKLMHGWIMIVTLLLLVMIGAVKVSANQVQNSGFTSRVQITQDQNNRSQNQSNSNNRAFHQVYHVAKNKLGDPYVYGATGPNRFDCSGFTKYIYQSGAHTTLPRTAQAQYNQEKHVSLPKIQKGDLVFFGYSKRSISHVGMYIGNLKMIDAQNRGVVIENVKAPWWHLVSAARVL